MHFHSLNSRRTASENLVWDLPGRLFCTSIGIEPGSMLNSWYISMLRMSVYVLTTGPWLSSWSLSIEVYILSGQFLPFPWLCLWWIVVKCGKVHAVIQWICSQYKTRDISMTVMNLVLVESWAIDIQQARLLTFLMPGMFSAYQTSSSIDCCFPSLILVLTQRWALIDLRLVVSDGASCSTQGQITQTIAT